MTPEPPRLSKAQWEFLALFAALDQPLSISLAGELAPLAPGPFLGLLRLSESQGWLQPTAPDTYCLAPDLPEPVRRKLNEVNSPERLSRLLKRLDQTNLRSRLSPAGLTSLLKRSDQELRVAEFEYAKAKEARQNGRTAEAARHLEKALAGLSSLGRQPATENMLIAVSLELSDLRLRMGQGLGEIPPLLRLAREAAVRLGDRRSKALVDLRLGRFSYVSDNLSDALEALVAGLDEVDELGDEDIIAQSSEFAGLYYFLQGMHRDAIKHYDRAMAAFRAQSDLAADFFLELTFGFCAAHLGQFHRAIGVLNRSRRLYSQSGEHSLAALFESALGLVLLLMGRKNQARELLTTAVKNSRLHQNNQAWLIARIGLVHCLFLEGQVEAAAGLMLDSAKEAAAADHIIRQYIFPFILEDLYCSHMVMDGAPTGLSFDQEMERIINGPNIHLRGTAYRLQARRGWDGPAGISDVRNALETSLKYLKRSGDPIEQAKTMALMARLEMETGDREKAAELARAAWPHLSVYGDVYFPRELKPLLKDPPLKERSGETGPNLVDRFLDLLEELVPSTDLDEMLTRVVIASSRFHEAERGGLFWFSGEPGEGAARLRASFNLTTEETTSEDFRLNLGLVTQAYRQNSPLLARPGSEEVIASDKRDSTVICLPVEVRGRVQGVLYHDNGYLNDPFVNVDLKTLHRVARQMSVYVERLWEYSRLMEKRSSPLGERPKPSTSSHSNRIIGQSPAMLRLIEQIDKVSGSEASVLVLGETGVGKELVAERIHQMSSRSAGPFIVVDMTAIPENLVESELFGHEKGAFTGADRQKPGRLELADGGTVFLDEVGEIPLSIQSKLLRALQEKTFIRVGGTKTLRSDFRLVAATNRDIEAEVAAGRFREDLYYRLNVIPLKVPPLRQRGGDILLLARTLLKHYERKHNRPPLDLAPEDEEKLTAYHWPGNVRELQNVIERAVLVSSSDRLELLLPSRPDRAPSNDPFSDLPTLNELQARYIRYVLEKTGGRIAGPHGAAALLDIKRSTLYTRMKKLGLES